MLFGMDSSSKAVLTVSEAAEYLRIPISTLYKLTREGTVPAQKLGKQWRYHRRALDAFLQGKMLTKTTN